jgi:tetratricopeptide (TPR) repeat protein
MGIFFDAFLNDEDMKLMKYSGCVGILVVATALVLAGCSSSGRLETEKPAPSAAREIARGVGSEQALQHFIDGSLCEMRGEYAKAVLEYQDALAYEKNHAIYFALAKCYSQLGKHSHAIEAGKEAVRLNPDNLAYHESLAEIYTNAFELDAAASQYEEIIKRDSSDIGSWYRLARLYQARRPLKALQLYQGMLNRFGSEWEVLLQMAELYNSMNQFDKAAGAMQRMLALNPSNYELKRSTAQAYVRAKQYDEALALYKDLLEIDPQNFEYIGETAAVYLMKKDYATAATLFQTILQSDSVQLETKLKVGEIYFGQVEQDSSLIPTAQGVFRLIAEQHPEDWRAYWFLGALGAVSHKDSVATANFRKVTELASWNPDGWVYLSSVFLERNNFQEVATILESALKVLPDDFRVNFYLGVAYNRLGRNIEAARVLEHARTINPKDMGAISQLALVYDGMRRHEDSDRLYEEALTIDSTYDLVLNNYAYSLAERGVHLARALEMAKKAVEAQPENPSYLDTIGWIYYQLGSFKEAEKYVKKSLEKGEANAVVYEHLGDIYYAMNDKERALEQWKIALKLDENNAALRDKISRGSL